MFRCFGKKENPQENTPTNPNRQAVLNNAMRIHGAHQAAIVDPGTTQENLIADAPYSTFAPIQVSSPSSTSIANHEQLQLVISGQADLPQREAGRGWISSSVSIGQDETFYEVWAALVEPHLRKKFGMSF